MKSKVRVGICLLIERPFLALGIVYDASLSYYCLFYQPNVSF